MKLLLPYFNSFNPLTCSFKNIYSRQNDKLFFIMDFSHVVKKIRNNLLKSGGATFCTRHLKFEEESIEWEHFRNAYLWDISNPFPIHHKLTQEHIFLNSESKMRNHLAEDVLNCEMLHLMEMYQQSLGKAGSKLNATVQLLKCTSTLIKKFRDQRPITNICDDRLRENHDAMDWFIKWENSIKSNISIKDKEKCLISHQTRQDIVSSVLGFKELCLHKLKSSQSSIIPSRVNSDIVENMFCQQRTLYKGANTNPTYLGYCHAVNSVVLGQASISRKSNVGGGVGAQLTDTSVMFTGKKVVLQ